MKKKTWCNYKRQILNELLVTNLLIIPLFWIIYFVAKRDLGNNLDSSFEKIMVITCVILTIFFELSFLIDFLKIIICPIKEEKIGRIIDVYMTGRMSDTMIIEYDNGATIKHSYPSLFRIRIHAYIQKYLIGKEIHFYLNKKKNKAYILYYYE